MNVSFFQELLTTISERGKSLIDLSIGNRGTDISIKELAQALMSGTGEASGVALAREILRGYKALDGSGKADFFRYLLEEYSPDIENVKAAAVSFIDDPGADTLRRLSQSTEPPRQELFRRLNLAPGATADIVGLREDLLSLIKDHPELKAVDKDITHLLSSWFNRGFLVLRPIDWNTPASILEKIIEYEAVHEIQGWDDLRRRLDPADRRCFGFFHPSLVDEPLIFVEVALTHEIPGTIHKLLDEAPKADQISSPTTAVFYSISNCQVGLTGISFGNFLIKQVVEDLAKEIPSLKFFVTLSPVLEFRGWIDGKINEDVSGELTETDREVLRILRDPDWFTEPEKEKTVKDFLMSACAFYFLQAKNANSQPIDPVARFHLGNGARLERINWLGDVSNKGIEESFGFMVNYLYDLRHIERNHEAFVNDGEIAASKSVRSMLREADTKKFL